MLTREFEFTQRQFEWVCDYAKRRAGINLTAAKYDLVYSRLARRVRALRLGAFAPYLERLESGDEQELREFLNALTTNVTSFFREKHHFDFLHEAWSEVRFQRLVKVWSCACSTGEEPYSIAITLREARVGRFEILASDINTTVLRTAAAGAYPTSRTAGLDDRRRRRWFRAERRSPGQLQVEPELRRHLMFRQINLMEDWNIRGPLDAIFCRNVIIYFDRPTQLTLFQRFADLLRPGGFLFLGHSESVQQEPRLELVARTTYQRASRAKTGSVPTRAYTGARLG